MNFALEQKAKILTGRGTAGQVGALVREAGYKKAFVIYDGGIKASGIIEGIIKNLSDAGVGIAEFGGVIPDPPANIVAEAAALCKSACCDCVIAVGGGSSIDTAKGVSVLRFNEGGILDYARPGAVMNYCPGLISIPTTSGTGSELSNGIIITDPETGDKVPIVGYMAMSEYVILDPELTVGMPPHLTVFTGLDVFAHAMEAYTTILSNIITDPICEKLMQTVAEWLPLAARDGKNMEAREKMHVAASLGGWMLANCCAHVGHSLGHTLGARFHLVHGAACAYACPAVLEFIAPAVPQKVKKIGEILGARFFGNETPEQIGNIAAAAYENFRDRVLGVKPLSEYGIDKAAALALAENVANECFAPLTPRKVTKEDAQAMLEKVFKSC